MTRNELQDYSNCQRFVMKHNKYRLYELSVQSARDHIDWVVHLYRSLRGKYARVLREDFCGTFALSAAWVSRNRSNSAIGVDLDPEPIAYGKRVHRSKLSKDQKKRVEIIQGNVLEVRSKAVDLILVGNFSFYVLKSRKDLVQYFKCCRRSLGKDGVLFLEMAGGPGMIQTTKERKTVRQKGGGSFTYCWDQVSFDPITHDAHYAIHFKFPGGKSYRRAFTYDWRLWTIPEVRDALAEAGFSESKVFWETEHRGRGTGEYEEATEGDNAFSWIAYVIGLK
jgi:SAM-dependent methyltransferase